MSDLRGKRVAVLMGGVSAERNVSLESGRAVAAALREEGMKVVPVDVKEDFEDTFRGRREDVDVAFIALHGPYGEDGKVQAYLEGLELPYTGSGVSASRLAMDKCASKEVFEREGISTPEFVVVSGGGSAGQLPFGFPAVVKPAAEGSAIGVSIVSSEQELSDGLEEALRHGEQALVEVFVEGDEISAPIFSGRCLPLIRIMPARRFYDYEAKYLDQGTQYEVPADLSEHHRKAACDSSLHAYEALGCTGLARADMIVSTAGDCRVLELNTVPGLTPHSLVPMSARAAGIPFGKLCLKMIKDALVKA